MKKFYKISSKKIINNFLDKTGIMSFKFYNRSLILAGFPIFIFLVFSFTLFSPNNINLNNIRSGLTAIITILGVIIGAILVVIGFLKEKGRQKESYLEEVFAKYNSRFSNYLSVLVEERKELVDKVKRGNIQLNDPLCCDDPSIPKYRELIKELSKLVLAKKADSYDSIENDLNDLGYTEREKSEVIGGGGVIRYEPEEFLDSVEKFSRIAIYYRGNKKFTQFVVNLYKDIIRDKIKERLNSSEASRRVLEGWILPLSIFFVIITAIIAISILFITKDVILDKLWFLWLIRGVMVLFSVSVIFILLLIREILRFR